jgi:hypothetical protein
MKVLAFAVLILTAGHCASSSSIFARDAAKDLIDSVRNRLQVAYQELAEDGQAALSDHRETAFTDVFTLTPAIVGLASVPQNAEYFIESWSNPASKEGVLQVLLCPQLVCPRFEGMYEDSYLERGIEAASKSLVRRLVQEDEFRKSYKTFMVWSRVFVVTGDRGPVDKLFIMNRIVDQIEAFGGIPPDDITWEKIRFTAAFAACIGFDRFFEDQITKTNFQEKRMMLLDYVRGHVFEIEEGGTGWKATRTFEPDGLKEFKSFATDQAPAELFENHLFDTEMNLLLRGQIGSW